MALTSIAKPNNLININKETELLRVWWKVSSVSDRVIVTVAGDCCRKASYRHWLQLPSAAERLQVYFRHARKHTHTYTHTHTHTHTHVGFYGLRGLSIGVMVFILYKLYVLLPYTYPTPKLSPHRRRCISIFPQKNSLCMIYKHFKLWGHRKCPHKSPSLCNTYVIPMSLYKFVFS